MLSIRSGWENRREGARGGGRIGGVASSNRARHDVGARGTTLYHHLAHGTGQFTCGGVVAHRGIAGTRWKWVWKVSIDYLSGTYNLAWIESWIHYLRFDSWHRWCAGTLATPRKRRCRRDSWRRPIHRPWHDVGNPSEWFPWTRLPPCSPCRRMRIGDSHCLPGLPRWLHPGPWTRDRPWFLRHGDPLSSSYTPTSVSTAITTTTSPTSRLSRCRSSILPIVTRFHFLTVNKQSAEQSKPQGFSTIIKCVSWGLDCFLALLNLLIASKWLRKWLLTAFWIFLNSFLVVPKGTNWLGSSTLMGVVLDGESSATHCNKSKTEAPN